MNPTQKIISTLLLIFIAVGCQRSPEPTKDQLISDLKSVYALVSDGDHMAAVAHFKGPEGISKEKLAKNLERLIPKRELSADGIEVLDKQGKFGKLKEVFPDRGESWMKRNGITSAENCYGLGYKNAEVAAIWDGSKFLLFRLDDVGKL